MNCFVIGTVLEPEVKTTASKKQYVSFGLLSGKTATEFTLWDDSSSYSKALLLNHGDSVVVICNSIVNDKGQLRTYINDIAEAPDGLSASLLSLFVKTPTSSRDNVISIPEPPAAKKVGS